MSQKRIRNHQKTGQKTYRKNNDPKATKSELWGDQNTTDKGGKGRDPGWNPPRKKKNTAKTRPTAGKGCMREGYTQTLPSSTRPCGGPQAARGRISVACGNSSAPGPREDSLHAKICKKFDTRVNAGVFFANFCLKNVFRPKRAKRKPRGCKIIKIWPYMAPKGTQFKPKGHQNEPKGCQKERQK